MQLTIFGLVVVLLAALLARQGLVAQLCLVMTATAFGASAAIALPALGGSTLSPAHFALLPLGLLLAAQGRLELLVSALRAQPWLGIYVLWGVTMAVIGPRLFEGQLYFPMKPFLIRGNSLPMPLVPTSQNITQAVYLGGTLVASLFAWATVRSEARLGLMLKMLIVIAFVHISFGLLDLGLTAVGLPNGLDVFRNGAYSQLTQHTGMFKRISGVFSEPSSYSNYGLMLLVANTEMWVRNIWSRWTGAAALGLVVMLALSTSTTAYIGLFAYGFLLCGRLLFTGMAKDRVKKLCTICLCVLAAILGTLLLMAFAPEFSQSVQQTLTDMTIDKIGSSSGQERVTWTRQGLDAFVASFGLGIGPGSFRSSSLLSAVLGTTGLLGALALGIHWHSLTRLKSPPVGSPAFEAIRTAAVLLPLPLIFNSPSGDPGLLFGVLSGAAFGLARVGVPITGLASLRQGPAVRPGHSIGFARPVREE